MSLLIILNMVIAVMGATFERVGEDTEAFVTRSKLQAILENYHKLSDEIRQEFKAHKYLLIIEVDPEAEPENEKSGYSKLDKRLVDVEADLKEGFRRVSLTVNSLTDLVKGTVKQE